jgi:hypothetical protein
MYKNKENACVYKGKRISNSPAYHLNQDFPEVSQIRNCLVYVWNVTVNSNKRLTPFDAEVSRFQDFISDLLIKQ